MRRLSGASPASPTAISLLLVLVVALLGPPAVAGRPAVAGPPPRPAYPPTRVADVVEKLHGVEVHDPYRWLEDGASPEVQAWVNPLDPRPEKRASPHVSR